MIEYTVKVTDNGTHFWYLNGKEYTEEEFLRNTAWSTL